MWWLLPFCYVGSLQPEGVTLAQDGRTEHVIVIASDASAPEQHAAQELARFLQEVTGAPFPVRSLEEAGPGPRIAVGPGAARSLAPTLNLEGLGADGIVLRTVPPHLLLTGGPGAPRGTLYAVYTFLEDVVGCRWWTSKVSRIPHRPTLVVPPLDVRYVPVLEYREPFYFDGFDPDWAVRNKSNGHAARLDPQRGGRIIYKGFVHTFYALVPPQQYFQEHPEWFSEMNGKRTFERAQLCLTNPELLAFVIQRVKEWLRETPEATIISVSQNDWHGRCECARCKAVEEEEGSPAGPLLRFVNAIAEAIEPEFPHVAIDTLAYQYTRKPPRLTRPRPNVIVRLCSIECSFAHPLEHERNRSFREDIEGWAKICQRLYIWDYVTNFGHYIQPHPNLRVLGPNIRFFVRHGVKGIFEEGNYQSYGGEFAELRAWVLAKLLWNPEQDDQALIREFLEGYYEEAAPFLSQYIQLIHDKVEETDHYLGIGSPPTAPFLTFEVLAKAEELFRQAERAVAGKPEVLRRVEVAHLPVRYVVIVRWPTLRLTADLTGQPWPWPETRQEAISDFERVCGENGITQLAEWGGAKVEWLRQQFGGPRRAQATPPPGCEGRPRGEWVDLQDDSFALYRRGELSDLRPDPRASDGVAAWMPGHHREWAVQMRLADPVFDLLQGEWTAYAVVRVEKKGNEGVAFAYGLYDTQSKQGVSQSVAAAEIADAEYHLYKIATFVPRRSHYLWVAPAENAANIEALWVDRFFLVRERKEKASP